MPYHTANRTSLTHPASNSYAELIFFALSLGLKVKTMLIIIAVVVVVVLNLFWNKFRLFFTGTPISFAPLSSLRFSFLFPSFFFNSPSARIVKKKKVRHCLSWYCHTINAIMLQDVTASITAASASAPACTRALCWNYPQKQWSHGQSS